MLLRDQCVQDLSRSAKARNEKKQQKGNKMNKTKMGNRGLSREQEAMAIVYLVTGTEDGNRLGILDASKILK